MPTSNPRGQDKLSTQRELKRRKLAPIGVIGDRSPVEHDGGVIYADPNGGYELHYFSTYDDEGNDVLSLYMFPIEDNVLTDLNWVDWAAVARCIGMDVDELKGYAVSDNVFARASVYEAVGMCEGFSNLDPNQQDGLSVAAVDRRYDKDINKAHKAQENRRGNAGGSTRRRANAPRRGHAAPGRDWELVIRGPDGFVGTTSWSSEKEAREEGDNFVDDHGSAYHYTVKNVGSSSRNPRAGVRGKHVSCGSDITAKECRQLQHVYESARARGASPERAAKQAWGSLREPRRSNLMSQARSMRKENGAGLGGFLGSLAGVLLGTTIGVPFLTVIMSTAGGALGAREAAPQDRKRRAAIGGGLGGVVGPLFAALGGWVAGKKPDAPEHRARRNPPTTRGRKRNPEENPAQLARRLAAGG